MKNMIITIGRQYGSGGRDIGKKIADNLNIHFYDREMLEEAAKESGICKELFEAHDEKPTSSFLYSLIMDSYSMGYNVGGAYGDMPLNHKLFLEQFDAIKSIADREPCVLIGRCADYALEEYDNCTKVFIYADMNSRIERVAKIQNIKKEKAKEIILKNDKQRSSYYNYYTNKHWGAIESYDLCVNSSAFDNIEDVAKSIEQFAMLKK